MARRTVTLLDRVGSALVAPRRALQEADRPEGAGQAPADLTLLIAVLFIAANLAFLARAVFLLTSGELSAGASSLLARLAGDLQRPLVALVAGFAIIWLLAGRRRDLGRDSDLACVAFIPVIACAALLTLIEALAGRLPGAARLGAVAFSMAWYAAIVGLAVAAARGRSDAPPGGEVQE